MPYTRLRPTYNFDEDRLAQLRAVVPEAFADGKIDWDTLRDLLGDIVEDPVVEHFGLSWPGKREARGLASRPSLRSLVPVPGEGIDERSTRNTFIEGQNLDVLKLIRKAYAGRVKMIYIDPPYNTGNDLIYRDAFDETKGTFLLRTDQADESGELVSNPKASGRFHSNWLNMMYSRILLARDLLSKQGVIFVSIDDNEIHNLRHVMDEIFGPENFVACVIWQKMDSPSRNDPDRVFSNWHDYILVYMRDKDSGQLSKLTKEEILQGYNIKLPDGRAARKRQLRKNGKGARREDRPTLWYPLTAPDGTIVYPIAPGGWEGRWVLSKDTWHEREMSGLTEWTKRDYGWVPYYIETAPEEPTVPWSTIWSDVDQNRQAAARFTELMGADIKFDNPKPTNLLRRMIQIASHNDDIILDFFAGSCSTAHAVLEQNAADGGNRRYVMVQIDVPTGNPEFPDISSIGKERVRRAAKAVCSQPDLFSDCEDLDVGFRAFHLGWSSFKSWTNYYGDDVAALQAQFDAFESPLVDEWEPDDLLVEIMLIEGFPLDSAVTRQAQFAANDVRLVESDFHEHRLWVCLDQRIDPSTALALAMGDNDVFVCLDSAVDDEMKLRLSDGGNLKTI